MSSIRNEACLYFKTLFYNKFCDWNYVFDTAFSPLFWLLDSYGKKLGQVKMIKFFLLIFRKLIYQIILYSLISNLQAFVVVCCMLMISIITISYSIGLPHWWEKSPVTTIGLLIFGNWLKINCIFHYVMGIISKPGYPPQVRRTRRNIYQNYTSIFRFLSFYVAGYIDSRTCQYL